MKRTVIFSLSILALIGCAKEVAQNDNTPQETVKYMTFDAVFEDDVTDHDTKATLDRNGNFSWDSFETIYFVDGSGNTKTGSYDASTEKVTVEEGDWLTASSSPLSEATKLAGFGGNGPIVVAKVDGPVLKFHHIGSVINLKFASIPLECLLTFSSGTKGGDGTFSFDDGGVPTLTGGSTNDVSVSCVVSASNDPVDVTISVPNLSYSGFTVQLSVGGKAFYQKITEKTFDLSERPTLLNMKQLTLPVYTVYGSKNGDDNDGNIFGSAWNANDTNNDMELMSDGYYKKSYTNAYDNTKFRVIKDRSYSNGQWPDENDYFLNAGVVDFTILFNPIDETAISIEATDVYNVAGTGFGSSWTPSVLNRLIKYNTTTYYKKFTGVSKGSLEYKYVKNRKDWSPSSNITKTINSDNNTVVFIYYSDTGDHSFYKSENSYSIAGSEALTGYNWDTGKNDMSTTENEFILSKTFSDISQGTYSFKVVVNHSWDENYGGSGTNGNYEFTITESKNVTIKFNILTHEITVE